MIQQYSGRKNHFSYKTGISLALPKDWKEVDDLDFAALYVGVGLAGPVPKIGISVLPVDESQPDAHRNVAALISQSESSSDSYQLTDQQEHLVDRFPALTQTSEWTEDGSMLRLVQKLTVVQAGRYIYTIASVIEASLAEDYFSIFDEVVRSIRYIATTDL